MDQKEDEKEKQKEHEQRILRASETFLNEILPKVERGKGRTRESWPIYFQLIANIVSLRATCNRRAYGALIFNPDHQILGTGYCGAPRGDNNCSDSGMCFREEHKIPSGCFYDLCSSIHAEGNAIAQVGKEKAKGGTIVVGGIDLRTRKLVTGGPCSMCLDEIMNVGLRELIYMNEDYTLNRLLVEDLVSHRRLHKYSAQLETLERLKNAGVILPEKS